MTVKSLPVVVGITGASGAAYSLRLMQLLLANGHEVHAAISEAARMVLDRELDVKAPSASAGMEAWKEFLAEALSCPIAEQWGFSNQRCPVDDGELRVWGLKDFDAGIASGSFRTAGMVICPCSMGTLAAVAHGMSQNLIHRAADVHLKERRPLLLVPRECPIALPGLRNMQALTEAGATILPAMPGFYHQPQSIADLVDFVVGRICDHLKLDIEVISRWGEASDG